MHSADEWDLTGAARPLRVPDLGQPAMTSADIPRRKIWKHDLSVYLEVDRRRGLAQIGGVVLQYLGV